MPKRPRAPQSALGRDARRLLFALAQDGASPARVDLRPGFLTVAAPRHGITSIVASVPEGAAVELVARDLCRWRDHAGGARLEMLPEGAAFARRMAAADGEDRFAAQHRRIVVRAIVHGGAPVAVNETESPLAWLARRKGRDGAPFLSPAQIEAGARFGRDVTVAQLLPRVTSDWSGAATSSGAGPRVPDVGDMALAARQRLDRAANAVGPELHGLLIDICGFQKGLEFVERERSWPPRAGKVVLRLALDRLAAHYGLGSQARGPDAARRIEQWGAEDYRPAIHSPDGEAGE
jgi:hypothetical protein